MKGKNLYATSLVMLAVGLILAFLSPQVDSTKVVLVCGGLFILSGVANMFYFLGSRDSEGRARMNATGTVVGWMASAAAIVLGLAMLIFQTTFVGMVTFMFAILVAATAVFQFFLLLFGSRPARLNGFFYIVPMLLVGAAVYIYMQKPITAQDDHRIILVSGIAFAVFGLASLIEAIAISAVNRSQKKIEENREEPEHSAHEDKEDDHAGASEE